MNPAALPAPARMKLIRADRSLDDHAWGRRSLAPGREQSRSLLELCVAAALSTDDVDTLMALATGVADLANAQRESFPDNLCCDLDFLVAHTLRRARASARPAEDVADRLARICRLQKLYGRDTAIRFSYVHDFVYGFDWAKWVGRDPDLRASVGPFDTVFLDHLERRAHVMLGLIAADDPLYGQIPEDQARNPFPFSREPAPELTLHRDLAARGLVPVEAWDPDATPSWRRPFAALRVERAAALGLLAPPDAPDTPDAPDAPDTPDASATRDQPAGLRSSLSL